MDDGDNDFVWLSPQRALLPELSQEFTALMDADGVSLADLLQGLEEERRAIAREQGEDPKGFGNL